MNAKRRPKRGADNAAGRAEHQSTAAYDTMRNLFGPLDGARIPGGCDHCNAYQTVTPVEAGMWNLRVHHDAWCPWYRARQRRRVAS